MSGNNGGGALGALRIILATIVTIAWGASVAISLWSPGRVVDPWVHLLTAAIATALFGPTIWKRNGR